MHINYVRAHGYGLMSPVVDPAGAPLPEIAPSPEPVLPEPGMVARGTEGY